MFYVISDKNIDLKVYRGMICSLFYLTAGRSDIMFSVCMWIRSQSDTKKSHLNTVKRILNI